MARLPVVVSLIAALVACNVMRPSSAYRHRTAARSHVGARENPIRKVVNMMKLMQNKIESERKKTDQQFDEYMCYCKKSRESLETSIAASDASLPQVQTSHESTQSSHAAVEEELKTHKSDRIEAKESLATATALRATEAQVFAAESTEMRGHIAAVAQATGQLEKGMGGDSTSALLQTSTASRLRKLVETSNMLEADHDLITAFLEESNDATYAPGKYSVKSGEIVGILKQMQDEMEKNLQEITDQEDSSKANFEALTSAKTKEIAAASKAIELKSERSGELAVKISELVHDIEDLQKGVASDRQFLTELETSCETKKKDYEVYTKLNSEELLAIADAIKILNDDDALELFKKAIPSSSASFLQLASTSEAKSPVHKAAALLKAVRGADPRLDFLVMTLKSKKIGIEVLVKKIDDLAVLIAGEQQSDDNKRSFCQAEIDKIEDEVKAGKRTVSDIQTSMTDVKEQLGTTKDEIVALMSSIKELDAQVAEATTARQAGHAQSIGSLTADNTAIKLLELAANRLNQFYNARLYKAPVKQQTEEERITSNFGVGDSNVASFVQLTSDSDLIESDTEQVKPTGEPQVDISYVKKTEEQGGVMALMEMMKVDLRKSVTATNVQEKDDQEDYEALVKAAASKRAIDSKAVSDKEGNAASFEEELHVQTTDNSDKSRELMKTIEELGNLHGDCDWLLNNFNIRKEARAAEEDSLQKAKAVLSGADYS